MVASMPGSTNTNGRRGASATPHPPSVRLGVLAHQVGEKFAQVEHLVLGQQATVVEGVEVENRTEQLRHVKQRTVDIVHQALFVLPKRASRRQAVNRPMEWIGWRRS